MQSNSKSFLNSKAETLKLENNKNKKQFNLRTIIFKETRRHEILFSRRMCSFVWDIQRIEFGIRNKNTKEKNV